MRIRNRRDTLHIEFFPRRIALTELEQNAGRKQTDGL